MLEKTDCDYSVRVKNGAGWRAFSRVRLMISVGQEAHEAGKLAAVVDWLNRNPSIRGVHVSVNDFLQRHNNYAAGFDPARADAVALSEGSLWLARNQDTLSNIHAVTRITRWQDWLDMAAYRQARAALEVYRQSAPFFAVALREDALVHRMRRERRGEILPASFLMHCENYLLEELAIFALQADQLPAAEIYPGSNLASAACLMGQELPAPLMPLSHRFFTRIDFARINQPAAAPSLARAG